MSYYIKTALARSLSRDGALKFGERGSEEHPNYLLVVCCQFLLRKGNTDAPE